MNRDLVVEIFRSERLFQQPYSQPFFTVNLNVIFFRAAGAYHYRVSFFP